MSTAFETAVTPSLLIDAVRQARATADAAEVVVISLAVEWAHAHPVLDAHGRQGWWRAPRSAVRSGELTDGAPVDLEDDEVEWFGIPVVARQAPAAFAAANRMSTAGGRAVIRDGLVLCHRLPLTWQRVQDDAVPVWRARRIAQAVLGAPADVAAYVDGLVAPLADVLGPIQLARLLDEAMLLLHAEEREIAQLEALAERYAKLHESTLNADGIVDMHLRGDWADLSDFDQALSRVAAVLGRPDSPHEHESLDVRRSIAVGILADPEAARALLDEAEEAEGAEQMQGPEPQPSPTPSRPRKQTVVHLHLSEAALLGLDPVGRDDHGRPLLAQVIRDWCGRTDAHLTVRPVVDLNACVGSHEVGAAETGSYSVPDRVAEAVGSRDRTCVFPWCGRLARRCDCDHVIAYADGGPTCACNLAPLCRHHHQLKTHAGWGYTAILPGVYLWHTPHRQLLLRTRHGTKDVTTVPRSPAAARAPDVLG